MVTLLFHYFNGVLKLKDSGKQTKQLKLQRKMMKEKEKFTRQTAPKISTNKIDTGKKKPFYKITATCSD